MSPLSAANAATKVRTAILDGRPLASQATPRADDFRTCGPQGGGSAGSHRTPQTKLSRRSTILGSSRSAPERHPTTLPIYRFVLAALFLLGSQPSTPASASLSLGEISSALAKEASALSQWPASACILPMFT